LIALGWWYCGDYWYEIDRRYYGKVFNRKGMYFNVYTFLKVE